MADDDQHDNELDLSPEEADKLLDDNEPGTKKPVTTDPDQLGDAGKRAIDTMKRERNAARKELSDLQTRLKKYEDEGKSESQRLTEALEEHKTRAAKAEAALRRREIAEARAPEHATRAQILTVAKRLAGDSDDDLEKDADELFAAFAPTPAATAKTASRPQERLRGGSEPDDDVEESDPRKLAALLPRRK